MKPTKKEILKKYDLFGDPERIWADDAEKAMQEYAELYHKENLREEFDKINCLTGYLERWLNNPLSVPPFELKDVIRESNEWIEDYLKTKG